MLTLTDMFCGAGGSSTGAVQVPGVVVRAATNHWQLAIDTHNTNHQDADHICADVSQIDPRYFPTSDILWASPECTNHSVAKGRKRATGQPDLFGDTLPDEAAERSRATMWDVPRFAEHHQYQLIITENVVDAARWVMWDAWLMAMDSLGYEHHVVYSNSMHAQAFGLPAPQSRDRMYVVFWRKGNRRPDFDRLRPKAYCPSCDEVISAVQSWKKPTPWGRYRAQYQWRCPKVSCRNAVVEPGWLPAASIIDWSDLGTRIGDRPRKLAAKTMARIQAGIDRYWSNAVDPLIVNHVSGADASRSSQVMDPTPTMVAGGFHASLLVPVEGRDGKAAATVEGPYRTQTTRNETALLVPAGGTWNDTAYPVEDAARTRTTRDSEAVVFPPFLTQFRDRIRDLDPRVDPLTTIVAEGANHGLVAPPFIAELRGGGSDARPVADPLATVTASGNHHALISTYYGNGGTKTTEDPLATVMTRDRHALISGKVPDIEDCLFRMLKPSEIKEAMAFGRDYVLLGNNREQVRMAGNAVCPPNARDLIAVGAESLEAA